MKYFHELTKENYQKLVDEKISYDELAKRHPQPTWCSYPNATQGMMGCWSLTSFMVKNKDFCKNCECLIKGVKNGNTILL